MGGHRKRGHRSSHGYREEGPREWPESRSASRGSRSRSWIIVTIGLVVWSLIAWITYALSDAILVSVAGSAGVLLEGGKDLATATGVGKDVGTALDNLNVSGLGGQLIALLRTILKPAIVVLWAIGAVVLIAAPVIVPRVRRLLSARRH